MNCRVVLSTVLLSLWASTVSADLPPPPHLKEVDPRVRFDGIEDYPDHVFFLRFYDVHGNPNGTPASHVEVKSSEVLSFKARRIYHLELLAMPRKDFDKRNADDPSLSWLKGQPLGSHENDLSGVKVIPNVRYSDVQSPPTLASAYASESPITEYRITLSDDGFFVDVLAITKPNFTPPLERWSVLLGGTFVVAALAGAGL